MVIFIIGATTEFDCKKINRQKISTYDQINRLSQFPKFSFSDLCDPRNLLLKYFKSYLKYRFSDLHNLQLKYFKSYLKFRFSDLRNNLLLKQPSNLLLRYFKQYLKISFIDLRNLHNLLLKYFFSTYPNLNLINSLALTLTFYMDNNN